MNRWIVAVVCASTFALVLPFGNEAEAARYGHKKCIASSTMVGAKSTWVCKASENLLLRLVAPQGDLHNHSLLLRQGPLGR